MKTWHRNSLFTLGALAVLGIAALVAAHLLVNPEKLKEIARAKAQAAWSRELAIGDVELGFFPVPWIEARDVAIANPAWAQDRQFFRAERVKANLALLPLIEGNVKLKSLAVHGGRIVLEAKDGHRSWDLSSTQANVRSHAAARDNLLELRRLHFENVAVVDRRKPQGPHIWLVREARVLMVPILRDMEIEAELARDGRPLRIAAKLDDGERFGDDGATTEGSVELDWGGAKLTLAGKLPLNAELDGQRLKGTLVAPRLGDMLAFFDHDRQPRVPIEARFEMTGTRDDIKLENAVITMGKLRATGSADVRFGGPRTVFDLRLASDDVEWSQALEDAGGKVAKGVPEGEILPVTPMGWGILEALKGKKGSLEAQIGRVKLGNGLELRNVKTKMSFDDDRLDVGRFTTDMLGGTASFKVRLEGKAQRGHLDLDGRDLLLERWFQERGKKIPFKGGPMQIKATLDSKGESMKQLAANMTGPVSIRMGRGVYASEHAEEAEAKLSSASNGGPTGIHFECVGANLPFKSGKAEHAALVGASTDMSRLLTSGVIDFREQKLELRGRLRPLSGVGLATFVGDVRIFGKMAKPRMSLDQPTALARAGAALATAGLSAAATAVIDVATVKTDKPCEEVFAR